MPSPWYVNHPEPKSGVGISRPAPLAHIAHNQVRVRWQGYSRLVAPFDDTLRYRGVELLRGATGLEIHNVDRA